MTAPSVSIGSEGPSLDPLQSRRENIDIMDGDDRALLVIAAASYVNGGPGSRSLRYGTFNGIAMPRLVSIPATDDNGNRNLEIFYLPNPPTGRREVYIEWDSVMQEDILLYYTLEGATQNVPRFASGTGRGRTAALSTPLGAGEGDVVIGFLVTETGTGVITPPSGYPITDSALGLIELEFFVRRRVQSDSDSALDFRHTFGNSIGWATAAVAIPGTRLLTRPSGVDLLPLRPSTGPRYNSGQRFNGAGRYDSTRAYGDLGRIVEPAVASDAGAIDLQTFYRTVLAVLAGRDTGAQLDSREAQFFAPDGTTRRLRADLDGTGNRTNTDLEPL